MKVTLASGLPLTQPGSECGGFSSTMLLEIGHARTKIVFAPGRSLRLRHVSGLHQARRASYGTAYIVSRSRTSDMGFDTT